jgi:spoIIIJ-associated protein
MEFVEAEGDTIDDAIGRALQTLGMSRERVSIEILSNASRGIFGIGGRKAKVRATVRRPLTFGTDSEIDATPESERSSTPSAPAPRQGAAFTEEKPHRDPAPVDDSALAKARDVLQQVVTLIGSEGRVEVVPDAEESKLVIEGDASGILIGRRGQTLDALEYLINRIVWRADESTARLIIDSQNYRTRRRDSLTELAKRAAERARKRGKTVTLNPMSPRDRRIVHLALRDEPALTTRSAGNGYFRKLLVIPGAERRRDRSSRTT